MADEYPDISAIKERLQHDWLSRDNMIEEMRALRYMEADVDVPADLESEAVMTPEAHQIVERLVGTLTANPMTITVPPADESEKAREQSSKMEKFLVAAVERLQQQAEQDVIDLFIESLVMDGHGCMRMLPAKQLWRGAPRHKEDEEDTAYNKRVEEWKKGKPLPIAWNWCDPLTIYPLYGEFGLYGVLQVDERDIATLHPKRWNIERLDRVEMEELSRLHERDGTSVEFAQWWTPTTLTYAVEDRVVHHQKHRYESAPYTYAFGLSSASNNPERMGMSVLWPIRDLIPALNRLLSQKASAVRMWCWPTVVFRQIYPGQGETSGEAPLPVRNLDISPGSTVTLFNDEELSFLTWTGNGPDADEMLQIVNGMIQKAGLADPMYGAGAGESGYALNQLIAAARMRLKPLVAHAERALAKQLVALCDIIEHHIKQPVYVYGATGREEGWISLGPDDLNGYRNIQVKLNPVMPTDSYARSSMAINEVNAGLRSRASAMEMIGVEQPDEEQRKILVDRWRADPKVQEFIVAEALKKAGIEQAKGDLTMQDIQGSYGQLGPGMQQALSNTLQGAALPGQDVQSMGMRPAGQPQPTQQQGVGGPATPMGQQAQVAQGNQGQAMMQQAMALVQQIATETGMSPDQVVAALQQMAQQMGTSLQELLTYIMTQAQQQNITPVQVFQMLLQRLQLGAQYSPQGPQVMAAPGQRAAPGPPPARVGRRVMPSGMATGRPPGTRRTGIETR